MPKAACQEIERGSGEEPVGPANANGAHTRTVVDLLYTLATTVRIPCEQPLSNYARVVPSKLIGGACIDTMTTDPLAACTDATSLNAPIHPPLQTHCAGCALFCSRDRPGRVQRQRKNCQCVKLDKLERAHLSALTLNGRLSIVRDRTLTARDLSCVTADFVPGASNSKPVCFEVLKCLRLCGSTSRPNEAQSDPPRKPHQQSRPMNK